MRRLPVAERRDILIAAAIRVIARDGLTSATTRSIVAEAGMPLGSFHYVFESRDDLLTAVIDIITSGERLAAESILVSSSGGPLELAAVLCAGVERYIDLLESDPEREQALLELSLYAIRRGDARTGTTEQYLAYYRSAEHLLQLASDACGQHWSIPLAQVARLLVVAVDGITTTWLADRDSAAARRTARFVADAIAHIAHPDAVVPVLVPLVPHVQGAFPC